ncbi:hypothetical protein D1AOALGA4SA_10292 [Olavius algarvensis Delta 1 endosymbiont]|nr:hypothetical protein D1AOALGA4SA_10292 [Olavius algarvensis Delta 1 endosymbiont]
MTALAYQRSSQRFEIEAPVMLEDFRTGFDYNGIIYNYSADGVYLVSDYAPPSGPQVSHQGQRRPPYLSQRQLPGRNQVATTPA